MCGHKLAIALKGPWSRLFAGLLLLTGLYLNAANAQYYNNDYYYYAPNNDYECTQTCTGCGGTGFFCGSCNQACNLYQTWYGINKTVGAITYTQASWTVDQVFPDMIYLQYPVGDGVSSSDVPNGYTGFTCVPEYWADTPTSKTYYATYFYEALCEYCKNGLACSLSPGDLWGSADAYGNCVYNDNDGLFLYMPWYNECIFNNSSSERSDKMDRGLSSAPSVIEG